jgi:hypothetical protein
MTASSARQVALDDLAASPRFTSEDYEKIQDYVTYGSSLPVVLPAVQIYVGYKAAGVAGLEPADLQSLFAQVRANASGWEDIGDRVDRQTGTLVSIASRVVGSGESLIAAIRAMPFYGRLTATVGQDIANLPPIDVPDEAFGQADSEKKSGLLQQLEGLRRVNLEQAGDTDGTMGSLSDFLRGIATLEPVVSGKRTLLKNSNLEKIGNEITVEPMIAALQAEYDRLVQTGGRTSAMVEAKRAELDRAIQTLKSQMDVYRDRQRVTYTMGRLFAHFTELKNIMVDAEMAVGHLWTAWKETAAALEKSCEGFDKIDSSRKLVTFLSDFQIMITNWKTVQARATELNRVF